MCNIIHTHLGFLPLPTMHIFFSSSLSLICCCLSSESPPANHFSIQILFDLQSMCPPLILLQMAHYITRRNPHFHILTLYLFYILIHLLIHQFNDYLLNTYYTPDTIHSLVLYTKTFWTKSYVLTIYSSGSPTMVTWPAALAFTGNLLKMTFLGLIAEQPIRNSGGGAQHSVF